MTNRTSNMWSIVIIQCTRYNPNVTMYRHKKTTGEWRWLYINGHCNTQTSTHQTPHSACLFQLIIHSLPLHEAVKRTPPRVPEDPEGGGQEGEAERGWWDTLFKPHSHTHRLTAFTPSRFPCRLLCIIHHLLCSLPFLQFLFSLLYISLSTALISQISLFVKKLQVTPGEAVAIKYTYPIRINHKCSCDSKERHIR